MQVQFLEIIHSAHMQSVVTASRVSNLIYVFGRRTFSLSTFLPGIKAAGD